MIKLHQEYLTQFHDWEQLGRGGLPIAQYPIALEPPYRPFDGYRPDKTEVHDDGRHPTFLSNAFEVIAPTPLRESQGVEALEDDFHPIERISIVEINVSLPPEYSPKREASEGLLRQIHQCSQSVALEIYATSQSVRFQFAVSQEDADFLLGTLRAYFPDAIFRIETENNLQSVLESLGSRFAQVLECGLGCDFFLPLETGSADPFIGMVGALSELREGQFGVFQTLFQVTSKPWAESIVQSVYDSEGEPYPWYTSEFIGQAIEAASQPLYATAIRLCAAALESDELWQILTKLVAPLHLFNNPVGNYFIPLAREEHYPLSDQIDDLLARQSRRSGMLLTAEELLGLVHMPSAEVRSPRFSRQVLHTNTAPTSVLVAAGLYLGENEHHGIQRSVYLSAEQRVRHTHVIGSSGTGKSTLLFNLIVDDIACGQGLCVLDPHGDLVDAILSEIPDERIDDVVLLDPSDETASVAFNILSAHTDAERIMLSSDLVSVFERLSTTWGDQMNIVLRNAILAFLESDRPGTLSDLRIFLTDAAFRKNFLQTVKDPDVRYYWEKTFPQFGTKQSVGAVVTRLETFLAPKPVRYIVSQEKSALDFADIMDSGKILLCRLSQGMIGRENAYLFGSLLVSKLQQSAMSRARLEESNRRHFWCYIDEFQNFITPSMAEILTEARKYRMGLVLAHQNLTQLERQHEVASAVLAETNIRIVFRVGDQDARKLSAGFSSFEPNDLQSLERGHAIVRIERSDHDFNVHVPLRERLDKEIARERQELVRFRSRKKFATPRQEVEVALRSKLQMAKDKGEGASPKESPAEKKPTSPSPSSVEKSQGKGELDHRTLQKQIREEAEKRDLRVTIERALPDGGNVDVAVENDDRSIACIVATNAGNEQALLTIEKCLGAGFDDMLLVCPNRWKRQRLRKAINQQFPNDGERILCISPSEVGSSFDQRLEVKDMRKRRGFVVTRKFSTDASAEARRRESEALEEIARILRGENA